MLDVRRQSSLANKRGLKLTFVVNKYTYYVVPNTTPGGGIINRSDEFQFLTEVSLDIRLYLVVCYPLGLGKVLEIGAPSNLCCPIYICLKSEDHTRIGNMKRK